MEQSPFEEPSSPIGRRQLDSARRESSGIVIRNNLVFESMDLYGTRESYRVERYIVKECLILQNTHIC